jgi:hypothetical protein
MSAFDPERKSGAWHVDAQCLGGFKVDHQFKFGRLLHRQIGRLGTLQYFVHPLHLQQIADEVIE